MSRHLPLLALLLRSQSRCNGAGYWAAGMLCIAIASLLISLRGNIDSFVTVVVANSLYVIGFSLILRGIRVFADCSPLVFFDFILPFTSTALFYYFNHVEQNINIRIVVISSAFMCTCAAIVFTLLRDKNAPWRSAAFSVATVFGLFIYQYNLFFAEHIDQLLNYAEKPLGDINKERWFNMNERIRSLGLIRSDLNDSHFSVQQEETTPFSDSLTFYLLSIVMLLFVIFFLWTREFKILTLLAVILVIVLFEMQFEAIFIKDEKRAVKENATQVINTISAKLQGELQNNLSLLTGFASYISATPELTNEDFARYAQPLFQKDPMLISFAAAKDLVINYVFPLK